MLIILKNFKRHNYEQMKQQRKWQMKKTIKKILQDSVYYYGKEKIERLNLIIVNIECMDKNKKRRILVKIRVFFCSKFTVTTTDTRLII